MSELSDLMIQSIYPVFIQHPAGSPKRVSFQGTGFFVELNKTLVFITAAHVGIQNGRQNLDILALPEIMPGDGNRHVLCQGDALVHQVHDFFVFVPSTETLARFQRPPKPLPFLRRALEPMTEVFTFGYPFTSVESHFDQDAGAETLSSLVNSIFIKGYIARRMSDENLRKFVPRCFAVNYQLNFPNYLGISGAPLLIRENDEILVAGLLYEKVSTEYYTGPYEVEEDINVRRELWERHDFGLASTHEPFLEIESYMIHQYQGTSP